MAITNPTKYVTTRRLGRFKEKLANIFAAKSHSHDNYATKTSLQQETARAAAAEADLAAGTLYPVDMDSITPSSTFRQNAVLGINGVIYRALNATGDLPVTLATDNGAFVYHMIDGHKAYVIDDPDLNSDWEIWTDASMEYWRKSLDNALSDEITNRQAAVNAEKTRAMSVENTLTMNLANGTLYPVDADSITPSSTFVKNAVLGINGVIYRALNATSELPVPLVTQGGAFVYHEINGHKAYVIAEPTVNSDWEVWTDSSMDYWRESFDAALDDIKRTVGVDTDYEFVDLGLPSGTLWAKCNVGATAETGYGNYYMYGKGATQYNYGDSAYAGTEDPLAAAADTATQVMGSSYHTPTKAQVEELAANTTRAWVENFHGSGINGFTFTAPNGNYIFIPAAGINTGTVANVNERLLLWTSTPHASDSSKAYLAMGGSSMWNVTGELSRGMGGSIRPVVDGTIMRQLGSKLSLSSTITYNGTTYTVEQLLQKVASLM